MPSNTTTVSGQQTIPEILEPYFVGAGTQGQPGYVPGILPTAQGVFARDYATVFQPLQAAGLLGTGRIAGLSPTQTNLGQQLNAMGVPSQFGTAAGYAGQAASGLGAIQNLQAPSVQASELTQYQMAPTATVTAPSLSQFGMTGAQTAFAPNLNTFQMAAPETFGVEQAQQYMSPYAQSVTDVAKRKAIEDARRTQLAENLGAGRRGALGASGNILATTERERALGTQLGDIQARGLESAYQSAQTQFERDRAARMGAAQQNLQAALGVQQLGTQTGLQAALANLQNEQAARSANLQAQLGVQQLGATTGLQAQQLNQAALQEAARQNLAAALGVQQLGSAQSLQAQQANQQAALQAAQQRLAASQGLAGLAATTGQLGVAEQAANLDRLKAMGAYGDLERAYAQQQLDARYQDAMRQIGFPEYQLGQMANILRGVPLGDQLYTSTQTTPPPSFASQLAGMGLSGLSLYNLLNRPS